MELTGVQYEMRGMLYLGNPGAKIIRIGDSGRHGQHLDVGGTVDDDLLPHCTPPLIAQVVHLQSMPTLACGSTATEVAMASATLYQLNCGM